MREVDRNHLKWRSMATDSKQHGVDPHDEVSTVVGLGFCGGGAGSNTAIADVKDGKLLRLRPLPLNWQYEDADENEWTMEARGKTFQAKIKALIPPFSLGYKKRVYSSNRVMYPLQRVDFDPNGAPDSTGPGGRNIQNRGKSKFKRISWDEALDIVESEIKRVHDDLRGLRGSSAVGRPRRGQGRSQPARVSECSSGSHGRLHLRGAKPRQLGRLALGSHARLGHAACRTTTVGQLHARHLALQ